MTHTPWVFHGYGWKLFNIDRYEWIQILVITWNHPFEPGWWFMPYIRIPIASHSMNPWTNHDKTKLFSHFFFWGWGQNDDKPMNFRSSSSETNPCGLDHIICVQPSSESHPDWLSRINLQLDSVRFRFIAKKTWKKHGGFRFTLWQFNIVIEDGPFILSWFTD